MESNKNMVHFELIEKYNSHIIYFRSVKTIKKLEEWKQSLCQKTLWKQGEKLKTELFIVYVSYMTWVMWLMVAKKTFFCQVFNFGAGVHVYYWEVCSNMK